MNRQNRSKINLLLQNWTNNTIAISSWLKKQKIYRQLVDCYEKNGWIEKVNQGAYKKSGDKVDWTGFVYTLQTQVNTTIHPASKTALQLQGRTHYIPADLHQNNIILFGVNNEKLPAWFKNYKFDVNFRYVMTNLFEKKNNLGLKNYTVNNYEIKISSLERAVLELSYEVPKKESFQELSEIMSALTSLRPKLVQQLLENCNSIKAKRVFMYLADKYQHPWLKRLNLENVDFGKGKRSICENGHYDNKYKIVVPKNE